MRQLAQASVRPAILSVSLLLAACSSRAALEVEPSAPSALPSPVVVPPVRPTAPSKLPILGDPLGLLSRPPERLPVDPTPPAARSLSPDALMAPRANKQDVARERDPRAVEREQTSSRKMPIASAEIHDVTASRVMADLRRSSAKLRVLFLYAAYCPACRNVMPAVRDAAKRHYGRGVEFTAASVDSNRDQYAAYVPTLEGVFPATLITSEGSTMRELKRLGLPVQGSSFGIPLIAVLDRRERVVAYGNSGLAGRLDQALDSLAEP